MTKKDIILSWYFSRYTYVGKLFYFYLEILIQIYDFLEGQMNLDCLHLTFHRDNNFHSTSNYMFIGIYVTECGPGNEAENHRKQFSTNCRIKNKHVMIK